MKWCCRVFLRHQDVTLCCSQPASSPPDRAPSPQTVLRSVLRPDNIDSWAWVTKSSKSVLFLPESSSLYTSPYTVSSRQLCLSSSISLFSLSLQSLIFAPPPFTSCLLRGSGIRGIPEGDFPCFRLSVWPLKNCLLPKTVVQGIQSNTCYTAQGLSSKHSRTNSPASAHPLT